MKQALITKIETTYTPDGQGGYIEETIEKGSYDVKLSVSKDVNEATAYGVKCEQILKVIADEPLKDDEASLWLIIGPEGPQGPKGDTGAQGPAGANYTITTADYDAIANVVFGKMTNAEQVRY